MGFGDWLRYQISLSVRSNLRSLKHGGTVDGVLEERAKIKAEDRARAEEARRAWAREYPPPSRPDGYYSRSRRNGVVDVYIAPNGNITSERPHVHIVHSDPEQRIIITPTLSDGTHLPSEYLPPTASGNDVNAVVNRLRGQLR